MPPFLCHPEHFGLHHHSDSVMIKSFGRISRNSNRADPRFWELYFLSFQVASSQVSCRAPRW